MGTNSEFTYRDIVKKYNADGQVSLRTLVSFVITEAEFRKRKLMEVKKTVIFLCFIIFVLFFFQSILLYLILEKV